MLLDEVLEITDTIPKLHITGITADSREVMAGFVFFVLKGYSADGHFYAEDAEKKGAVALVVAKGTLLPNVSIPIFQVDNIRHALAFAAARFYRRQPDVIAAVTGTSGKTSVVSFLRQIWEDTGFSAASIGTVGVVSTKFVQHGCLTTPGPVQLHRLLQELTRDGITHVALEASSHGIEQCRIDGVCLAAAAFTNFGRDHLDYHITTEAYFQAKMRLFDTVLPEKAPAIIYTDNKYSQRVIEHVRNAQREVLTVGSRGSFIRIKRVEQERFRQYMELISGDEVYEVILPLSGEFQVANVVVAAGLAVALGDSFAAVCRAIERLKNVSGRLEYMGMTRAGASIYIDYAHKPDALEHVLKSVRHFTKGRLVVVFGCGGDRDKGKRSLMGEIASEIADIVIVTDDNPRTENAAAIRRQILLGASKAAKFLSKPVEIGDRREAIRYAVTLLQSGDTLVIAGKGHEEGQIIGKQVIAFSDHAEVRDALEHCKL